MGQLFVTKLKLLFRDRANMIWTLMFPIALGTLFYIAFANLGKSEEYKTIPVAVVCQNDAYGEALELTVEELSSGTDPFLDATICTGGKARHLLEEKKVVGIVYSGETARLSVNANATNDVLNQSILQSFVEEYNLQSAVVLTTAKKHPEKIADVVENFDSSKSFTKQQRLQRGKVDTYIQYFYNQLAMACLYAAMAGILVATGNQGNISALAARKNLGAVGKHTIVVVELIVSIIFQYAMNLVGFLYLSYVLKVGVDTQLPYALLALFVGVVTGVSLGFFIGSIGKADKGRKTGIMFAVVMPLCFFSGLMVGNMRIVVEEYFPIFNRINPAALISDSFYCLSIFDNHVRYTQDLVSLFILSVAFILAGIIMTRRTRYASI